MTWWVEALTSAVPLTCRGLSAGPGWKRSARLRPGIAVSETKPMTDKAAGVAALLHEAGETHHLVYRIVDGNDPDWASWYADWLLHLSELPQFVANKPIRSELVWLLVSLDKEYTTAAPQADWPGWYADRILQRFGAVA